MFFVRNRLSFGRNVGNINVGDRVSGERGMSHIDRLCQPTPSWAVLGGPDSREFWVGEFWVGGSPCFSLNVSRTLATSFLLLLPCDESHNPRFSMAHSPPRRPPSRTRTTVFLKHTSEAWRLADVLEVSNIHEVSKFIHGEFLRIKVSTDFEMESSDPLICGLFI